MAGRVRRGFGYLRRLPSKQWQASYMGPDLARHLAPQTFSTKMDAEAWLAAERNLIGTGAWVAPKRRHDSSARSGASPFGEYAEEWLRERPLKPKSRDGYRHLMDKYLLPSFGTVPLEAITTSTIRRWWSQLDDRHPTVNARAYALLKAILNTAVADELVAANPCRLRSVSNPPRVHDVRPATLPELETITSAMPPRFQAAVLLGAWCALRIGEILALQRDDIDLAQKQVRVERAVTWVAGQPVVGTPKSSAGSRRVAVPPHVIPALAAHLDQHVALAPGSLLFPNARGQYLQPSTFHKAWRKARAAAGREDLRVHDLRHTGATLAAMTGASLAELQQRLGHSTVGAALRYQHAAKGRDAEIAERLSALVEGDGGTRQP